MLPVLSDLTTTSSPFFLSVILYNGTYYGLLSEFVIL